MQRGGRTELRRKAQEAARARDRQEAAAPQNEAEESDVERPVRRRSSPMEPASRLNPLTQQHCDTLSKHGLWRCDCTESEQ